MEGNYDLSACERERILLDFDSSRRSLVQVPIHYLPRERLNRPRDPSCRESSIHRSGSLSYTDNLPEVSRACQSFLASSRQDFTHSLYARRPFETQSIHRSAKGGMCRGKLTFARAARPPLRDESAFRHTCVLQATYFL